MTDLEAANKIAEKKSRVYESQPEMKRARLDERVPSL